MANHDASVNLAEKQWLSEVINRSCNGNGILRDTVSSRLGQSKGFMSYINRVQLHWDHGDCENSSSNLPTSVIIKKPSLTGLQEFGACAFKEDFGGDTIIRMHNRECIAYEYLDTINSKSPIPVPKCYYKRHWTSDQHGLLILEDLSQNTSSIGFSQVATEDQTMVVTEHLANLHAYGCHEKQFPPLPKEPFFPYEKSLETTISQNAPYFRQNYPDIFKYSNEAMKAMVERIKQPAGVRIFQDPSDVGYTPVVCLGDVQRHNILWRNPVNPDIDSTAALSEIVAFIDFQCFHVGNCMSDLAYFMMLCVSAQDRPVIEEKAIRHYIDVFQARMQDDDTQPVVSLSEAEKLYKISLFQFCVTFLPLAQSMIQNLEHSNISVDDGLTYLERMVVGIEHGKEAVQL